MMTATNVVTDSARICTLSSCRRPDGLHFMLSVWPMSIDVVDLRNFYAQRLGVVARRFVGRGIRARFADTRGMRRRSASAMRRPISACSARRRNAASPSCRRRRAS